MPPPATRIDRRLWLVRHGITAWNAEGRWQGSIDVTLSDAGRAQADALGRRLAGVPLGAAFASTLARSTETARRAVGSRLTVLEEPLLRELSYGEWEGVRDVEVGQRWPAERETWWTEPHALRPGGGESLDELAARAWRGLLQCLQRSEGDLLVVAHGGVNRVLLCRVLGLPLARFWSIHQDPTGVNLIEIPPGAPADTLPLARIRLVNCTGHLERTEATT